MCHSDKATVMGRNRYLECHHLDLATIKIMKIGDHGHVLIRDPSIDTRLSST